MGGHLKSFFSKAFAVLVFVFSLWCTPTWAQSISGTVTLTAMATDVTPAVGDTECGVGSVQFFIGTTPLSPVLTTPNSGTNYVFSWNTATTPNGNYVITAKALDKAGHGPTATPTNFCDGSSPNVGLSNALNVTVNNVPPDTAVPTITITLTAP
jgi:hypothetical protein